MTYQTVNPATGETEATFAGISDAELDAARACFLDDWRHRTVADRARVVKAAAAGLRAGAARYAQLVMTEMGKQIAFAEAEVGLSAAILDYCSDRAEEFLAPRELPESPGAVVEAEPIGVILAIEPWNFPYYQLARVAGPRLMAGNVVVVKHAESVPQCALAFAGLFAEAGAPAGAYAAVAERAGRSLKKVVMELGGSDPFIVLPDADLGQAVEGALFGRMFNTGQSCVSSKRIIVVGRQRGDDFLRAFREQLAGLEFFGPVASFYVVDTEDEAITLANATPFGLGASVFTRDTGRGREVARRIDSGMVFINNRKLVNVAPAGSPPWGPVPVMTRAGLR